MGIENIKMILGFIFQAISTFEGMDDDGDGKVDAIEVISVVTALGFDIVPVIKAFPNLKDEFNDLSQEEAEELANFFDENFDITNDKVEQLIELGVDFAVDLAYKVSAIRDILQEDANG